MTEKDRSSLVTAESTAHDRPEEGDARAGGGGGVWPTLLGVALSTFVSIVVLHLQSPVLAVLHPRPMSMLLLRVGVAVAVLAAVWAWTSPRSIRGWLPPWVPELLFAATIGALFMSAVFYSWAKPWPSNYVVGSLVPYSDAESMYHGGVLALEEGRLDPLNCRRPMTALLLAVRLGVTGGDLRLATLIQVALLALAVALFGRVVALDLGWTAACWVAILLFAAAWWYVPLVMSEPLGVTLGCLATAALWSGARRRSLPLVIAGIFATAVAQTARMGTVFVLPALVLWVLFIFKKKGSRWGLIPAVWAIVAILTAFTLDGSLRAGFGCGFGPGNGNFALTLYGFTTGSPGWAEAYQDFPELRQATEEEVNRRAYAESWNNIRQHPGRFVYGLSTGAAQAMRIGWDFLRFNLAVSFNPLANGWVLLVLAIGVVRYAWLTRHEPMSSLLMVCLLGVLVSAPIILPDAESRALAPAFPLIFLPICAGVIGWRPTRDAVWQRLLQGHRDPGGGASQPHVRASLVMFSVLLVAACLGPGLLHLALERPAPAADLDDGSRLISLGPRTTHLSVLGRYDPRPTFAPRVNHREFESYLAQPSAPPGLADGVRPWLDESFVLIPSRRGWIIGPPELIADRPRRLRLTGRRGNEPYFRFFHVESYDEIVTD